MRGLILDLYSNQGVALGFHHPVALRVHILPCLHLDPRILDCHVRATNRAHATCLNGKWRRDHSGWDGGRLRGGLANRLTRLCQKLLLKEDELLLDCDVLRLQDVNLIAIVELDVVVCNRLLLALGALFLQLGLEALNPLFGVKLLAQQPPDLLVKRTLVLRSSNLNLFEILPKLLFLDLDLLQHRPQLQNLILEHRLALTASKRRSQREFLLGVNLQLLLSNQADHIVHKGQCIHALLWQCLRLIAGIVVPILLEHCQVLKQPNHVLHG
mmetsp:Transcript_26736/g.61891  ORF Transcript_26736/g.61891 Transcript_26736/m.61891 type:complete len:270 (-) Transcript_26736:154-963(-)